MSEAKEPSKSKALHELMEGEFQQLVDIIEQKRILHEGIKLDPPDEADPITHATRQLQQKSQELGSESLVAFFNELECNVRDGSLNESRELLENIETEFENVKNILSDDQSS